MAITVPTSADVQALYDFMLERANEEWEAINSDETLDPEIAARFYRVSNSNKIATECASRSVLVFLDQGDDARTADSWHLMTAAGEQWRNHHDFLPAWENPQLAEIRRQLEG